MILSLARGVKFKKEHPVRGVAQIVRSWGFKFVATYLILTPILYVLFVKLLQLLVRK